MSRLARWADIPMRIYLAADSGLKLQIIATNAIVFCVAVATVSGDAITPEMHESGWFAPQTLMSLAVVIYGVGSTVQQSLSVVKRLDKLEANIPLDYVRKDVFEERMRHPNDHR